MVLFAKLLKSLMAILGIVGFLFAISEPASWLNVAGIILFVICMAGLSLLRKYKAQSSDWS